MRLQKSRTTSQAHLFLTHLIKLAIVYAGCGIRMSPRSKRAW